MKNSRVFQQNFGRFVKTESVLSRINFEKLKRKTVSKNISEFERIVSGNQQKNLDGLSKLLATGPLNYWIEFFFGIIVFYKTSRI